MSRSFKKHPFFTPCAGWNGSDKLDRQWTHRLFRHREKVLLAQHDFDRLPFKLDELRTEWDYRSDGPKIYWKNARRRDLGK